MPMARASFKRNPKRRRHGLLLASTVILGVPGLSHHHIDELPGVIPVDILRE